MYFKATTGEKNVKLYNLVPKRATQRGHSERGTEEGKMRLEK